MTQHDIGEGDDGGEGGVPYRMVAEHGRLAELFGKALDGVGEVPALEEAGEEFVVGEAENLPLVGQEGDPLRRAAFQELEEDLVEVFVVDEDPEVVEEARDEGLFRLDKA